MGESQMSEALLVVQFLSAVLSLGGNISVALQETDALLRREHDAGRTVTREALFAIMDKGDILEADAIARAREAMERQG